MRWLFRYLGLLIVLMFLASCSAPRPTTQTKIPGSSISPSMHAPAVESPTISPTVTPTPVLARLKNLRFSPSGDIAAAQPSGTIFDAGQPAMYAIVDYANWPVNTPVEVEVRRNGVKLPLSDQPWTDHIAGTSVLTIPLITDSYQLIPNLYRVTVHAEGETLEGVFRMSDVEGKPGTVLIAESFENNAHGLTQWKMANSSGNIKDGRFQLTTLITSDLTTVGLPIGLGDFDATFEVQRDPTSSDAIVGCLFRAGGERGAYAFEVMDDGSWLFERDAPVLKSPIYRDKNASAIKADAAVNRFRIIGQGNRFTFYANGIKLGEVIEDRFNLTSGGIAPGVRSPTGKPVMAWIDNVIVALPETPMITGSKSGAPSALKAFAGQIREAAQAALQIEALLGQSQLKLDAATCAEIMPRFYQAVNVSLPDVTDEPSDVKRAVRSYENITQELNQAIPPVQKVCEAGGGLLKPAEFEEFTSAIRWASDIFWGVYIATK